MSVRIGNKIVAGMPEKALHGIGEIFTTTDTGVIAGAVEANGGSYNLADYNSGTDSIASKLVAGTLSYVSKAEFQTRVANTGACDSFGWDGASDTTFLVPKLNPWHVGKNAPVVGNGISIGYTDGTNLLGEVNWNSTIKNGTEFTTAAYNQSVGTNITDVSAATSKAIGLTTDGTKSGMIVDLSETTNLRVMVQLATGATDQALETCTSVLSDVSALNAHRIIEFQAPTAENGYTWYRKYADGWVEQGGVFDAPNNTAGVEKTITLPLPMTNDKYTITIGVRNTTNDYNVYLFVATKTSTTITFKCNIANAALADQNWQVSGMSAQ